MRKTTILLILLSLLIFEISGCKKEEKKLKRIALISGLGGFNDNSFNQSSMDGFLRAKTDFTFSAATKESFTLQQLTDNLQYFASQDFDLIIAMGYNFADPVLKAAVANPGIDYLIIDFIYPSIPPNVQCAIYAVDQSSFPAGVLAAYWADLKDSMNPVAGFVAGPDSTISGLFATGYLHGIAYYNTKYDKHVDYAGWYASSYTDTVQGALLAEQLINNNGADIIYQFAGMTGNGSLTKAKQSGKWGIGVDVDQYYSLPAVKDILLTSCMKKIDNTVYDVISGYVNGKFAGGTGFINNLSNKGVGLAPYHDYETQIPDSIKSLIRKVMDDIKNGTLSTGVK